MNCALFHDSFTAEGLRHLKAAITLAWEEDGPDLTAEGIFSSTHNIRAHIVTKETTLLAGLALIPFIHEVHVENGGGHWLWQQCAEEGSLAPCGTEVLRLRGPAVDLLKVERIILNFISHLSGIANVTSLYVQQLEDTGVRLLDTRKTLPCLRWPAKYAVRVGGGHNHRRNLTEMLMLKDNHIDAAGSIAEAVAQLRKGYSPCPPIEVECRSAAEVLQAVAAHADRIMLDNMDVPALGAALPLIPQHIEAEISGGVTLDNIRELALAGGTARRADFISVGRLTHSAPAADFSMRLLPEKTA